MKQKTIGIIILSLIVISLIQPVTALLGTFKQNTDVDLIQTCNNCTYCNITSIKYPGGDNILTNVAMTKDETYYNYTLNESYTSEVGQYKYCFDCGNEVERATGCINFDVTLSGNITPEGVSYIYLGVIILFFGISGMFLFLSVKLDLIGFKIFFLLLSLVFLIGNVAITSIIATDSNLTSGVNTTIGVLLYALGIIFFVIFAYIMIEQIRTAIDLIRQKKGYEKLYG